MRKGLLASSAIVADAVSPNHVTNLSDINRVVPSVQIKGTCNGRVPYGVPLPADSFAKGERSKANSFVIRT